jgi:hypothetical protein
MNTPQVLRGLADQRKKNTPAEHDLLRPFIL